MILTDAQRLIGSLMREHGLLEAGWTQRFDRASRRFGQCQHGPKRLSFSENLVRLNSEDEVRDTALHEIAHALVGPGHGHGPVWQAMARKIGADPSRCYGDEVVRPQAKWTGTCNCGPKWERMKLASNVRYGARCPSCRGPITWRNNF